MPNLGVAHLGIIDEILDDLFFVQPSAISIVQFLRKIPVVERLDQSE